MDYESPSRGHSRFNSQDDSVLNSRSLEGFGRKVTAAAGQIIGPFGESNGGQTHYHSALTDIHRELRAPIRQRQLFALSQASPRELVRSKLSVNEIQHRALTYLPEELLTNVPQTSSPYSLFQGFEASIPDDDRSRRKGRRGRWGSRGRRLLGEREREPEPGETPALSTLRNEKHGLDYRLETLGVRKNMCSTEIREIDTKISNLNSMRGIVLDRLADLEQEESQLEHKLYDVDSKLEELEEEMEDEAAMAGQKTPTQDTKPEDEEDVSIEDSPTIEPSFMSESIYEKLPTPKKNRPKPGKRKTTFILHEHLQSGSKIREFQAHDDMISAMDFDYPFGTMVTAGMDDTVRVWDLNAGRCIGLLEGHLSSVRCLQVEDNIVATGSMDASVRLWDLSQADYTPSTSNNITQKRSSSTSPSRSPSTTPDDPPTPSAHNRRPSTSATSTKDCELFTLSAHVAEVTALNFHNSTLISGSADKTLRQWDLEKGRCVQTLDVLWAAAQASSSINTSLSGGSSSAGYNSSNSISSGRNADSAADFVGALQCYDAALACGTADGMVRLWDLRSGQVHRSLVGHTGPVTSLQFDDVHLVTGSADRSIRIWDLRTGSIVDAWGYDNGISSMMFDSRRVVTAAGDSIIKVYDKTDGRHWECGGDSSQADAGAGAEGIGAEAVVQEEERGRPPSIVERVRIKDGYLVDGRRDGVVGVWSC